MGQITWVTTLRNITSSNTVCVGSCNITISGIDKYPQFKERVLAGYDLQEKKLYIKPCSTATANSYKLDRKRGIYTTSFAVPTTLKQLGLQRGRYSYTYDTKNDYIVVHDVIFSNYE